MAVTALDGDIGNTFYSWHYPYHALSDRNNENVPYDNDSRLAEHSTWADHAVAVVVDSDSDSFYLPSSTVGLKMLARTLSAIIIVSIVGVRRMAIVMFETIMPTNTKRIEVMLFLSTQVAHPAVFI